MSIRWSACLLHLAAHLASITPLRTSSPINFCFVPRCSKSGEISREKLISSPPSEADPPLPETSMKAINLLPRHAMMFSCNFCLGRYISVCLGRYMSDCRLHIRVTPSNDSSRRHDDTSSARCNWHAHHLKSSSRAFVCRAVRKALAKAQNQTKFHGIPVGFLFGNERQTKLQPGCE